MSFFINAQFDEMEKYTHLIAIFLEHRSKAKLTKIDIQDHNISYIQTILPYFLAQLEHIWMKTRHPSFYSWHPP